MTLPIEVTPPYQFFTDQNGRALEAGIIFIGVAGLDAETNPVSVFWDRELTILASQPIRTVVGAPDRSGTPSDFFVDGDYSITVNDKNSVLVYSKLEDNDDGISAAYASLVRDAASASFLASLADGTIAAMDGLLYKVDSTAIGSSSATADLGVDGLVPFGCLTPQHFGAPTNGLGDCQPATQRLADYAEAQTGALCIQFPPNITYLFNSQVRFDNPERTVMELRGARIEWDFDGRLFDMNKAATDQLPISVTADTYTKRDQYIYGGDFHYTGVARTNAYAIQAFYMRGFYWQDFYVEGARGCAIFGAKDTYKFENFRTFDCVRYFETPEEGVLHAAGLTGNDLIAVLIDGQIAGPTTAEWGVYFGARTLHAKVAGNINGNFTAGHVKIKDGSVIATRAAVMAFRSEQLENTRVAVDFDASRGTGFLTVNIIDGMEIAGINGWYGINFAKCVGVNIGNVIFLDGAGAGVSTERGIYIDDDCRDVRINTESTLFTGIATGREIILESAAARENITLTPENQFLDSPLTVTGYNGVITHATKAEILDVEANIGLPGNRVPILPPKSWMLTANYKTATPGTLATSRFRLGQANEAGNGMQSINEGITMWSGAMPANFVFSQMGNIRCNDNGDLWVDILSPGSDAIVTLQVSGYCQ